MNMRRLAALFVAGTAIAAAAAANATPVIFIVRHAEKAATSGNDPELSPAGHKRAEALSRILKDAGLTAIFTTEFKRTQETAAPTAAETQISPTVVAARDAAALMMKLRAVEGNALVVGHGNTIPDLLKSLGVASVNIPDDDYSELVVVSLGDTPQLVRLHFPF